MQNAYWMHTDPRQEPREIIIDHLSPKNSPLNSYNLGAAVGETKPQLQAIKNKLFHLITCFVLK